MNARTLIRILVSLVVVLAAVASWFAYRLYAHHPVTNPLENYPSLADSARLDAERKRLAAEYEKKVKEQFAAAAAREEALRQEMSTANAAQKKQLEDQIAQLHARMEDFAGKLDAWRKQADPPAGKIPAPGPTAEPEIAAPPLPPPVSPEPSGGGGEDDRSRKEFQQFVSLAVAGFCLAQPELCPIAETIGQILGGLGLVDGGTEVVNLLDRAQKGLPVDPKMAGPVARLIGDHPELAKPLGDLLAGLEKDAAQSGHPDKAGDLSQLAGELLPRLGGIDDEIKKLLDKGPTCDELKSFLVRDGADYRFASVAQREAIHSAIVALGQPQLTARYWDGCLAPLSVR